MKKLLFTLVVAAAFVGCAGKGTKENANSNVVSESTGGGTVEKVDTSPMNFTARGTDSGQIEGLYTIHFDYDKSTLTAEEQKKLDANAEWLMKNKAVKMLVEGHCDSKGSTEYNLSLGERRANAMKQMLVKKGIAVSRITTQSYGKEKPLVQGDGESEMAQNRRANFVPSNE